ncbi:hypothetical protein HK104_000407 [Borealophlyctis nickersoniae]|nr:hypothetical protein HK104_000407 [Borealophlyctis nickersoniae]
MPALSPSCTPPRRRKHSSPPEDFDSAFSPILHSLLSTAPRTLTPHKTQAFLGSLRSLHTTYIATDPLRANRHGSADLALAAFQKHISPWLVKVLDIASEWDPEGSDSAVQEIVADIADLMAQLCGRTAGAGTVTRTWKFDRLGDVVIREPPFEEADVGFQTWGAGVLLAKLIDDLTIPIPTTHPILELGSGTGLVSLVASLAGANLVYLSDYNETVLNNAKFNVEANGLDGRVEVVRLDWRELDTESKSGENSGEGPFTTSIGTIPRSARFHTIFASDCIYEPSHAVLLPRVVDILLSHSPDAQFIIVLPMRDRFQMEVALFEKNMKHAFVCAEQKTMWREEDPGMEYRIYTFERLLS